MITPLQVTWFVLIGVLFAGYSLLAGYDLGIGILHLFASKQERARNVQIIAPYWDANEVWLLTAGGALFAAFPSAYATIFSAFYLPLMIVLWALIIRAISIEYRSKVDSPRWRAVCDYGFGIGSLVPTLLFGVALGNIIQGLSLDDKGNYTGTFFQLLSPFPLLMGVLAVVAFSFHGALFAAMEKPGTEGDFKEVNLRRAKKIALPYIIILWIAIASVQSAAHPGAKSFSNEIERILAPVQVVSLIVAAFFVIRKMSLFAFLASAITLLSIICNAASSLFPRLIPAKQIRVMTFDSAPDLSLTIANASSSHRTLQAMLIIALIGVPIVLAYTIYIHRLFRTAKAEGDSAY